MRVFSKINHSPRRVFGWGILFVPLLLAQRVDAVAAEQPAVTPPPDRPPLVKLTVNPDGTRPPIYIKSDTFHLDARNHTFTYRGNVQAWQDDVLMTADVMNGNYDEHNKLQIITCENNVVITRGDYLRASSNRAVYHVPQNTVELTESPELINRGNALTADKVTPYLDEDRNEAEGDVRVKLIEETAKEGESPGKLGIKKLFK